MYGYVRLKIMGNEIYIETPHPMLWSDSAHPVKDRDKKTWDLALEKSS